MEKIAFIYGDTFIYWNPIILALAAVAAIGFYLAVHAKKKGGVFAAAVSVAASIALSIPLARLIHWYCRTASYESFEMAMTDYSRGGYALAGVFFGCLLAACLTRLVCISYSLPQMLDSMAIGGSVGIAVGRLACVFNTADRGMIVPEEVGFPFAYPVVNAVSGAVENRLATFMIQSMLAGAIALLLLAWMLVCALRRKKAPDGDVFMVFLLAYGASQIICDSTRYDSLFLRSNGFVSIVQILGLVALLIPIVWFSIRMVRNRTMQLWYYPVWVVIAGLLGLGGYMEYYVQRHGNEAVLAYSVMGSCLVVVVILGFVIRFISTKKIHTRRPPRLIDNDPQEKNQGAV